MPGRQGMKIPDLFDGNNDGAVPWGAGRQHFADHMKFRAVMMVKDFFGTMAVAGFKFIANSKRHGSTDDGLFDGFKHMPAGKPARQIGHELRR